MPVAKFPGSIAEARSAGEPRVARPPGRPHIVAMNEVPPGKEIVPYDPETYAEDRGRVEAGFWAKVR